MKESTVQREHKTPALPAKNKSALTGPGGTSQAGVGANEVPPVKHKSSFPSGASVQWRKQK